MSAERTQKATELVKKLGGEVEAMYATLGANDLIFVLSLPDNEAAIKASVALSKMSGISFSTAPAVTVAEFDKLMGRV
jgi:uncharacterized protein with GYD domain